MNIILYFLLFLYYLYIYFRFLLYYFLFFNIFLIDQCRRYNREELVSLYLSGQSRFKKKVDGGQNIVQFYGATISRSEVYIFMKLMEGQLYCLIAITA